MVNIFQRQGAFWYSGERGLKKANVGEKWKKKSWLWRCRIKLNYSIISVTFKPAVHYLFIMGYKYPSLHFSGLYLRCCTIYHKRKLALWRLKSLALTTLSMLHGRNPFGAIRYTLKLVPIATKWHKTYKLPLLVIKSKPKNTTIKIISFSLVLILTTSADKHH